MARADHPDRSPTIASIAPRWQAGCHAQSREDPALCHSRDESSGDHALKSRRTKAERFF